MSWKADIPEKAKRFIRDYPVPEGTLCGGCGSANVCKDCGHTETVYSHLARVAFSVEPLEPKYRWRRNKLLERHAGVCAPRLKHD